MNKTKALILTTVFIDVVGLGIIIPILPFYVARFSASPLFMTSLFAVYALCSFLSAPIIGSLSDRLGRKVMLTGSILSTSIGWFVFAFAPNAFFLFLGRIIDGAAAGNIPIAQAYLVDISKTKEERTTNLGLIGAVFGMAFIIGPLLGGVLGSVSKQFPFIFVGALALINGILGIFFLPETHTERDETKPISINPFVPLIRAVKNKILLPNYTAWFFFGLAIASFQSVFAIFIKAEFGFEELATGIIFTCIGVIIAINQAFFLKRFWLKRFKEPTLELVMLFIFIVGFLLMTIPNLIFFTLGIIGTTFGQSVLRTVMNAQIAAKSDPSARGEVLGVTSSITNLSLTVGPLFAGYLFTIHIDAPFFVSAFFLAIAFSILYMNRSNSEGDTFLPEEVTISEI